MKALFDPVTSFLNRSAWIFWAILWISLSLGAGQEELIIREVGPGIQYDTTTATTICTILLWAAIILQIIRQVYYSNQGPKLVRLGRWLILGATSIFAFRMTYMLSQHGGAPSSYATLIGVSLLALGICLNSIGMMQQSYFQDKYHIDANKRWLTRWHREV
jgi:hypothetical protein